MSLSNGSKQVVKVNKKVSGMLCSLNDIIQPLLLTYKLISL